MKKNWIVSLIMITFLLFSVAGCGYTLSELSPAFETENISKIAFKFGPLEEVEVGKGRKLKEGKDIAVLSLGPIGNEAMNAIASAEAKSGKSIAHYDLRFLKPLDEEMLDEIGKNYTSIVTIEDGVLKGGMGSAILEYMADHGYTPKIRRIGIPDCFVQHGTPNELYKICGMDATSIENVLLSL